MSDAQVVQTGRLLSLTSPLGKDALIPTALDGTESLSRPFRFVVEAVSLDTGIAAADLLGQSVTLAIARPNREPRRFNGVVRRFEAGPTYADGFRAYRLELVPSLWLLTRTSDCRIFQDKSVIDIVDTLLAEAGLSSHVSKALSGTYKARPYCVQYRETDFDFFARLLEEEGIYYFFKHEEGTHTLVLGDGTRGYEACPDSSCVVAATQQGTEEGIQLWRPSYSYRSGKWTLGSYDFESPDTDLVASTPTALAVSAFKKWERYDWHGTYTTASDGSAASRILMEAEEAAYAVVTGTAGYRGFMPGTTFTLADHPVDAERGKSYVLRAVTHEARDRSHLGHGREAPSYGNRFECLPADVVFRPERETARPIVHGLETATVTGPSGEEIYCDSYGRIKIHFPWDRAGRSDETSSCYVRVAQIAAGRNRGTQFVPRIGMEVLVAFLDGNPDRPLVVGSVYNGANMPTYALPANKTQSGIKTRSSPQDSTQTSNELRFEDKKGSEQIYLHAQKDFTRDVVNDDTLTVDHDRTVTVKNDHSVSVDGKETLTVKKTRGLTVTGAETRTNKDAFTQTVTKNFTLTVDGDITIKAAGKVTIEAGSTLTVKSGSSMTLDSGSGLSASAGKDVTIDGTNATMSASSSATVKAGASVTVKGSASGTFDGGGTASIKGGMIKLN